jgi:hypothetical protein
MLIEQGFTIYAHVSRLSLENTGTHALARLRLSIAPDDFAILAAEGVVPNEGLLAHAET